MLRSFLLLTVALALVLACARAGAQTLGTTFTYSGELQASGTPATGPHDMRFRLYESADGGSAVGSELCVDDILIEGGRFTVQLDFGAQFGGFRRWLEVSVRPDAGSVCGVGDDFTILSPRQPVTATPYALFALNASNALTASDSPLLGGQPASFYRNATNINSGTLPNARLSGTYTGLVSFTNVGNTLAGSGAGIVGLNATNIASGVLNDARLSSNIPRLDSANVFLGPVTATSFIGSGADLTGINASNLASGTVPGSRLSGAYGNALSLTNAGNVFAGSGAALTGLQASNVTAGTLSDARLSANVALLAGSQTFSGQKTFSAVPSFSGGVSGSTPPFNVTSTTQVPNLNASLLGGSPASAFAQAVHTHSSLAARDGLPSAALDVDDGGFVGVGTSVPLANLHVRGTSLGLTTPSLENDDLIIEAADATLGLYSSDSGSWGSAIALKQVDGGVFQDTWGIARRTVSGGSDLRVTYGLLANYANNPAVVSLKPDGLLGVGTTSPLTTVHVQGSGDIGALSLTPGQNNGTAELWMTEGPSLNFGFVTRYDGPSSNELRVIPVVSGVESDPVLTLGRGGGATIRGPLHVDGAITRAPAARRIVGDGADFRTRFSGSGGADLVYIGTSVRCNGAQVLNPSTTAYAPVDLPHGATIDRLRAYMNDSGIGGGIIVRLRRSDPSLGQQVGELMCTIFSDNESGFGQLEDRTALPAPGTEVVDRSRYAYSIEIEFTRTNNLSIQYFYGYAFDIVLSDQVP